MPHHDPVVNRNEFRVVGMSRSGNHAIIQWLIAQVQANEEPQRICWLNCVEGKYNPYWTARPFDDGDVLWANYQVDLEAEKQRQWSRKDYLIYNHEDAYLRNACSNEHEAHHDEWLGATAHRRDILILRDPFNLFASRLRSLEHSVSNAIAAKMWKQHAKQFLGRLRLLRHDPVLINYNRWCGQRRYRQQIADQLGLPFTDQGKQRVTKVHGGSSFDGMKYDGQAEQMRVHDRWRHYIDQQAYRDLFDKDMIDLAEQVFGDLPAIEMWRTPHLAKAG